MILKVRQFELHLDLFISKEFFTFHQLSEHQVLLLFGHGAIIEFDSLLKDGLNPSEPPLDNNRGMDELPKPCSMGPGLFDLLFQVNLVPCTRSNRDPFLDNS